MDKDEMRRNKARQMRMKKPIANKLNLYEIENNLSDIAEDCYTIEWMEEDDEILLAAFDGDTEEAFEFRTAFSALENDCNRMIEDLNCEYINKYFDIFFVAIGGGRDYGWLGYDVYIEDYFGISAWEGKCAEEESIQKLTNLTKKELIEVAMQCFNIYQSYIALKYRYDCLKSSMDILKQQNADLLKQMKEINELYDKVDEETEGFKYQFDSNALKKFDDLLDELPREIWI